MASPVMETEGMDIKTWLKSKDLEHLTSKFTEAHLTLNDILQCSEQDIRDLCKDNNWSTVVRIKLISALKSTPGSAAGQSQPQIIFLGDKEKEILEKLYKKTERASEDTNQLQKAINGLEKSAIECNKDIHSKCDILISIIEKKRKLLLNTVNELKNKRRSELEVELNKLQEISQSAIKSQNECKTIAMKPDISSSLRLEKMNATIDKQNEVEKKIDFDDDKINKSNVKLMVVYDQKSFNSNFDSALRVKFDDEQFELKYQNDDEKIEILKFSQNYKSQQGLELSDDNRCVKRVGAYGHKYILVDAEPVTKGIHCWRIQNKYGNNRWIMWSVSEKKTFSDRSLDEIQGGFKPNGFVGQASHNKPDRTPYQAAECEVDMLLNIEEGKLDLCVVGCNDDKHRAKFWDLKTEQHGWIPHFSLHYANTQIRIAKIPISLFGKPKKDIFK